ncbi:PREDICTED: uncharacterized protein LOC109157654 [Ipomoea nil]|uniref:uncharacterized protein LOC109157654 n=1 Tax=Ipomoea nil TaxID=35883 RepID=UPI00090112E4|nr:PREDICTED: uncharacterized protein LOC109157654 [Ipomoea nil]
MAKRGKKRKKRYGMSGAGHRNVKCDTKDSKFEKISTQVDGDYMLYLETLDSSQESCFEWEDSLDHNDNDNDIDPQYRIFLDNTVQKGTAYVTTLEENGLPLYLHYEKEEVISSDERNDVHRRKVKKTRKGGDGKYLEDLKVKGNVERPRILRSDVRNCEKSVLGPLNPVSIGRRQPLSGKQHEYNMKNKSDKEQRTSSTGAEEKYLDKDYALFLQCMQCEGYTLKALFPDNQHVEYDRDDSGDDEVLVIDSFTFHNGGSFHPCVPSTDYCEVGNTLYEDSQFRQEIISILRTPYDQAEFEKLLQDVKVQKPIDRNLELRHGRERRCPSNRIGKSYLDHFDGFNNKLEEVSPDKHKMLNILRGFFYWLQNMSKKGAFKPWEDPKCLAVMPGSC